MIIVIIYVSFILLLLFLLQALYCSKEEFYRIFGSNYNNNNINLQSLGVPLSEDTETKVCLVVIISSCCCCCC